MSTLYAFDTQKCVAHKTHFPCNQTTLFVMYVSDSLKMNHLISHLIKWFEVIWSVICDWLKYIDSCIPESDYTDSIVCV